MDLVSGLFHPILDEHLPKVVSIDVSAEEWSLVASYLLLQREVDQGYIGKRAANAAAKHGIASPGDPLGNQLESIANTAMRRLIVAQVVRLKSLALRIKKAIATVIAGSPNLAAREALLRSAPGVGPIVATCLLAHNPNLDASSADRLQPSPVWRRSIGRQSGKTSRLRRKPSVRRSLYLAARTIARSCKGHLAATTSRLRKAGKPFKLAIVATMRQLLVTRGGSVNLDRLLSGVSA